MTQRTKFYRKYLKDFRHDKIWLSLAEYLLDLEIHIGNFGRDDQLTRVYEKYKFYTAEGPFKSEILGKYKDQNIYYFFDARGPDLMHACFQCDEQLFLNCVVQRDQKDKAPDPRFVVGAIQVAYSATEKFLDFLPKLDKFKDEKDPHSVGFSANLFNQG